MPKPEIFFVTPELQQVLDNLPSENATVKAGPFETVYLAMAAAGQRLPRDSAHLDGMNAG